MIRTVAAVALLGLLGTCSTDASGPDTDYVYEPPVETDDGWRTGSLADAGIDEAPIREAVERIRRGEYPRVHSMLIARHGRLVLEEYFPGRIYVNAVERFGPRVDFDRDRIHNLASVTKSVTSMLTGLAIDRGFIENEDVPIHTLLPRYADYFDAEAKRITLRHLLTMTSGWEWHENTDWSAGNDMYGFNVAADPLVYLLEREVSHEPGSHWTYNGGAVTLLGKIIEVASGMNLDEFSARYLFEPLGISRFHWPIMRPDLIAAHGDLKLRPRDMAKLGQTMLSDGTWDDRQILSVSWVRNSVRNALTGDYGYLWWGDRFRNRSGPYASFSARGWGGQRIHVFPDLDLVVVFTGGNYESWEPVDAIIDTYILAAVRP